MSRVGLKPIELPDNVDVQIADGRVVVKGPKGELQRELPPIVQAEKQNEDGKDLIVVQVAHPEIKHEKAMWGTTRSLIQNMVKGVTEGFSVTLEVVGVGYRVNAQGKKVVLEVGYSHPVEFQLPEGIDAVVEKNVITISGIDKQLVGEIAAQIRKVRKPEPYKGKGIKYIDEQVRRKAGKAAKASA